MRMLLTNCRPARAHLDAKVIDAILDAIKPRPLTGGDGRMMSRVGLTLVPTVGGVLILARADSASHVIVGTLIAAGGLLAGAGFWWDARRSRRK
jgi:hypothetical protein